jgi:hypothetical protein
MFQVISPSYNLVSKFSSVSVVESKEKHICIILDHKYCYVNCSTVLVVRKSFIIFLAVIEVVLM